MRRHILDVSKHAARQIGVGSERTHDAAFHLPERAAVELVLALDAPVEVAQQLLVALGARRRDELLERGVGLLPAPRAAAEEPGRLGLLLLVELAREAVGALEDLRGAQRAH